MSAPVPWLDAFLAGESSLTPTQHALVLALGTRHYEEDRFGDAADLFRLAALDRPQSSRAWFSLASCHEAVDDTTRAASLYRLALAAPEDDGGHARARLYLARLLAAQGSPGEAESVLEPLSEDERAELAADPDLGGILEQVSRAPRGRSAGGSR